MIYTGDIAAGRASFLTFCTNNLQTVLHAGTQMSALMTEIFEESLRNSGHLFATSSTTSGDEAFQVPANIWQAQLRQSVRWTERYHHILAEIQRSLISHGNSHIDELDTVMGRSFAHAENHLPGEAIPAVAAVRSSLKEAESAVLLMNAITSQTVDMSEQEVHAISELLADQKDVTQKTKASRGRSKKPASQY